MIKKITLPINKSTLLVLFLFLTVVSYSQTVIHSADFENSLDGWTQDTGDTLNWTIKQEEGDGNSTPSGNTGPSLAASNNYFLYTEATSNFNKTANLISPTFDLSGVSSPLFNFYYHMYGQQDMGTLNVDISTDGGLTYSTNLWSQSGQVQTSYGAAWIQVNLNLNAYIGQSSVKIRFRGLTGGGYRSDMAIDNVSLTVAAVGPEINVTDNDGTPTNILDGDNTPTVAKSTDFGDVFYSSGNNPNSFIIENNGTTDLTVNSVVSSNATEFAVTGTTSGVITPGNSIIFTITFDPTTIGTKTAVITILSNDVDEATYTFNVEGVGVDYCISYGRLYGDNGVNSVNFNTLTNSDTDNSNATYEDFTAMSTDVSPNSTYNLSVNVNTEGNFRYDVLVWIDWNQDGDFDDAQEEYDLGFVVNNSNGSSSLSPLSLTVPNSALIGSTRMRVSARWDVDPTSCGTYFYGEVEDYTINIVPLVSGPEINVTDNDGTPTDILDGDNTPTVAKSTDFGSVNYVSGTNPNSFIIENNGTADLTVNSVVSSNATEFAVTGTTSGVITPGNSITFTVTFDPSALGLRTGIITIDSDDVDEGTYNFDIQGTGDEPEINIQGGSPLTTIANGDSSPSTAKGTIIGSTSTGAAITSTFTIQNIGGVDLTIGAISFSGADMADFTISVNPVSPISASGSTTFTVAFDPQGPSLTVRTAIISIVNNDNNEDPYTFTLQGTAITPAPEINVQGNSNDITDGFNTISNTYDTDFGSLDVAAVPVSQTFTIQNTGSGGLSISSITSSNSEFTISGITLPTSVAGGNSITFNVVFDPSSLGTINSIITINNDDSDEATYTFEVEGIGTGTVPAPQYTAYYNNFDSSDDGWAVVTTTNDTWIRTNTFNNTTEMGEGYFWRNSNYNNYLNNTNIVIESPVYDFTGLENILFSIDVKYNTQNNYDGMRILYSISGGAYTLLGSSSSGTNWYQDNVSVLGSDGWNDDGHAATPTFDPHSEFGRSSISLSNGLFSNVNNVRFRIEFRSDGGTTADGVAFDNVLIEADPITPLSEAAIAPANITSNLRLWLKTNEGVSVADGASLTNWEDQAYDTALDKEDAYASNSLAPIYRNNGTRNINFNPVADFDHNNTEYMQGKGGYFSQDYFVVFRSDDIVDTQTGAFSPGREFPIGGRFADRSFHEDPTGLGMGSSTARYTDEILAHNISSFPNESSSPPNDTSYGRAYTTTTVTYQNHPLIVNVKSNAARTSTEIYKNGKRIDNTTGKAGNGVDLNFNEFNNLQYLIGMGRSGITGRTTSQLNGMLTEVISYTSPNSAINQQKIQSYLGIKYGVTLQDDTSGLADYRLNDVDYIDSQGAVIWDTGVNSGYNYDIAGIGRDDVSILNQKQSRSQNDETDIDGPISGFLTIGLTDIYNTNTVNISSNTTIFTDRQFLMWGNNNASLDGAPLTVEPDMSADITPLNLTDLNTYVLFEAIPRIWKVVEVNGDIPEVEVSIPVSAVRTAVPPDGRYLMFISATGTFDPTADYRVMTEIGGNLYTHYDFDGTEYITFGWAPEREFKRSIYFDPADTNYVDMEDALDLDPNGKGFTVSAWIKRLTNSGNTSILSKRDATYTEGYDFKITSTGEVEMSWGNSGAQKITSNTTIPINKWHHVAVIYGSGTANLYIDGVLDKTASLSAPVATSQSFFIAAAGKNTPQAYFHGNIDEVRIWDIALSEDQLHYIMNQEIEDNTNFVAGKVLPQTVTKNEVSLIPWTDLAGYYPMSVYTYTNTKDESGNGNQGALKNLRTVDWQTAPLPYVSATNTILFKLYLVQNLL